MRCCHTLVFTLQYAQFRVIFYLLFLPFLFQSEKVVKSDFFSRKSSNFLDGHSYVRKAN